MIDGKFSKRDFFVFSGSRSLFSFSGKHFKKIGKGKFIDTWQSFMLKELLEKMFNCVDVFHPNPAVKNTNVLNRVCLTGFFVAIMCKSHQMYFYRHGIKKF
jgi:hypothetical protein